MRRKDRERSREFALEVTDKCEWAVLSMTDLEGKPYAVPLTIVRDGESVYFHTAKAGRKIDILRQSPAVCLVCVGDTERQVYYKVRISGHQRIRRGGNRGGRENSCSQDPVPTSYTHKYA